MLTWVSMKKIVLIMLGLAGTVGAQTAGGLGIFEGAADVGAPSHKGSVVYDAVRKEYRVTGGGENMWGAHDDFFFVWRKVTGDVVITANLKIVTDGAPHRKAGLIIRKDLETGSVYADAVVHGAGLTSLQWREKPDDVTRTISFPVDGPTRLRLERRRNVVTLYAGKEGGALAEMGGTELAPFSPMYAGLGVCAHDDKAETTAVFSDVTVEVLPPPAPPADKK
jgi:TolB protein